MTCDELVELVTSYLEGSLSAEVAAAFEAHLAECPGCDRYLAQFRRTIELIGELPEESISPSARGELLTAFAQWHRRTSDEG